MSEEQMYNVVARYAGIGSEIARGSLWPGVSAEQVALDYCRSLASEPRWRPQEEIVDVEVSTGGAGTRSSTVGTWRYRVVPARVHQLGLASECTAA